MISLFQGDTSDIIVLEDTSKPDLSDLNWEAELTVVDSASGNITINNTNILPEASQSAVGGQVHFDLPIKEGDVIVSTFATNQLGRYTNIDFIPLAD